MFSKPVHHIQIQTGGAVKLDMFILQTLNLVQLKDATVSPDKLECCTREDGGKMAVHGSSKLVQLTAKKKKTKLAHTTRNM